MKVKLLSRVWLFATLWTVAHQAPPSMGFSRQEYWSGLPFPSPSSPLFKANSSFLLLPLPPSISFLKVTLLPGLENAYFGNHKYIKETQLVFFTDLGPDGGEGVNGQRESTFAMLASPCGLYPDKRCQSSGPGLEKRSGSSSAFQLPTPWTPPFWLSGFLPQILYDLGAGQRWEGLGAQPERGMGRGRRLRKEKQLELISWGLAKKEAQALGNLLVSCLLLHNPLPASSAACVTQDLAH